MVEVGGTVVEVEVGSTVVEVEVGSTVVEVEVGGTVVEVEVVTYTLLEVLSHFLDFSCNGFLLSLFPSLLYYLPLSFSLYSLPPFAPLPGPVF